MSLLYGCFSELWKAPLDPRATTPPWKNVRAHKFWILRDKRCSSNGSMSKHGFGNTSRGLSSKRASQHVLENSSFIAYRTEHLLVRKVSFRLHERNNPQIRRKAIFVSFCRWQAGHLVWRRRFRPIQWGAFQYCNNHVLFVCTMTISCTTCACSNCNIFHLCDCVPVRNELHEIYTLKSIQFYNSWSKPYLCELVHRVRIKIVAKTFLFSVTAWVIFIWQKQEFDACVHVVRNGGFKRAEIVSVLKKMIKYKNDRTHQNVCLAMYVCRLLTYALWLTICPRGSYLESSSPNREQRSSSVGMTRHNAFARRTPSQLRSFSRRNALSARLELGIITYVHRVPVMSRILVRETRVCSYSLCVCVALSGDVASCSWLYDVYIFV